MLADIDRGYRVRKPRVRNPVQILLKFAVGPRLQRHYRFLALQVRGKPTYRFEAFVMKHSYFVANRRRTAIE